MTTRKVFGKINADLTISFPEYPEMLVRLSIPSGQEPDEPGTLFPQPGAVIGLIEVGEEFGLSFIHNGQTSSWEPFIYFPRSGASFPQSHLHVENADRCIAAIS